MVTHEAGDFPIHSMLAWYTYCVLDQPGLHSKTLTQSPILWSVYNFYHLLKTKAIVYTKRCICL